MSAPDHTDDSFRWGPSYRSAIAPPRFNFDDPGSWMGWKKAYQRYHSLARLTEEPDEFQIETLLNVMGLGADNAFEQLDESDKKEYDQVMNGFDKFFAPWINRAQLIEQSYRMMQRGSGNMIGGIARADQQWNMMMPSGSAAYQQQQQPMMGMAPQPMMGMAPQPTMGMAPQPMMGMAPKPMMGMTPQPMMGMAPQQMMGPPQQLMMGMNQPGAFANNPQMQQPVTDQMGNLRLN